MPKQLKLKNYFFINNQMQGVLSIQEWLSRLSLHGKDSRFRTRFIKILVDRVTEVDKERVKMLEECTDKKIVMEDDKEVEKPVYLIFEKDENGRTVMDDKTHKPKVKEEVTDIKGSDTYKISDENMTKFEKMWKEYLDEELVIDVTPATNETIYGVRDLVLNTEEKFAGRMALLYEEWCVAFEGISKESK
jgi:hypothetical protein